MRHLATDGILDGRAVVEGRVTLDDMSRSNEVAMLAVDGEPKAVLKRRGVAVDDVDPLRAEVDCLGWLAACASTAAIAPDIITTFDDIVVTAVGGSSTLSEALAVADRDEHIRLLRGLGRSLAVLHSADPDRTLLVPRRPWVLDVVNGNVPHTLVNDPGIEALVDRVNRHPELVAAIQRLAASWTTAGVVHGDIKFDNVVVTDSSAGCRPLDQGVVDLVLVDWELAGLGPAVWDLAGVVVGMIVPQILEADVEAGLIDLVDVERDVAPMFDTYRASADAKTDDAELVTATVVRMVQTSFQLCAMRHLDPGHDESSIRVFDAAAAMASVSSGHDELAMVS